jgi:hypothetical protein
MLTPDLVEEFRALKPAAETNGYWASFVYCIYGRPLRSSAYKPVVVLYRRERAHYRQVGHTQELVIDGQIENLSSKILHDDRKPLSRWVRSQDAYLKLEASKLLSPDAESLTWADRLNKLRFPAPFVMLFYCLFVKRAILDGRAGIYYAFQRMFAELLLSLYMLDDDLNQLHQKQNEQPENSVDYRTDYLNAKQRN